jgi:hypothetical protein
VHDELCPGSRLNWHDELSTMTWWSAASVFFHVTESPLMIVTVVSLKPSFVMSTPSVRAMAEEPPISNATAAIAMSIFCIRKASS